MDCQSVLITISALLCVSSGDISWEESLQSVNKTRTLPNLDECGRSSLQFLGDKIINGKTASLGEYPWIAAIGYVIEKNSLCYKPNKPKVLQWLCGGSLITDQYVLSAAHCLNPALTKSKGRQYKPTTVRLGDIDIDPSVDDTVTPVDYEIEKVIHHEEYDNTKKINDIGLVKLKTKVTYSEYIHPICLPPPEFLTTDHVGYSTTVAGWGVTELGKRRKDTRLFTAELEIRSTEECRENITSAPRLESAVIDHRVVCASGPEKGSCQGDSGGPLMLYKQLQTINGQSEGNVFLMGIVSYGHSCAKDGYPSVFTRVSEYMRWIVDNLDL